ncbi:MAG TPA: CHASE2 domain-containing protein, partial [Verrucomicrobiae bacterium]|nr:CHASE2 domain-containing protein [Verrucomicrobiae bacterium]
MLPRSPFESRALVAAGVAILIGVFSIWLLSPMSRLGTSLAETSYDWSQEMLPETGLSNSPVVIVYLDLESYRAEKQNPVEPWSRALHAKLLDRLTTAGAKAVVFDIIFDEAATSSEANQQFAAAMRANGQVVLAGEITRSSRNTAEMEGFKSVEYSLPAPMFLKAAAAWGTASLRADSDFVVRQYFPGFMQERPSLTAAAARVAGLPAQNITDARWVRYYGGPLAIPHVSY